MRNEDRESMEREKMEERERWMRENKREIKLMRVKYNAIREREKEKKVRWEGKNEWKCGEKECWWEKIEMIEGRGEKIWPQRMGRERKWDERE